MTKEQRQLFQKIRKHLFSLHTHWEQDKEADGHHKSSEGLIEITYSYPNWFEADSYLTDEPKMTISVYSYLFGPSRMHDFTSLEEAWEEISKWKYV